MKSSRYDEERNRPCSGCTAPTESHTDYPLCARCFRYLTLAYCGPRSLTEGIRDGLAALDHYRAHHGLTGPPPTTEVWAWLLPYLQARGAYARRHRGRIPPVLPVESDSDRRHRDRKRALLAACRSPAGTPAPG